MTLSWRSHDFLKNFPWLSHGFLLTFYWFLHDLLMTLPWLFHDFCMTFSWLSLDFLMTFSWTSHDTLKNSQEFLNWPSFVPFWPLFALVYLCKRDKTYYKYYKYWVLLVANYNYAKKRALGLSGAGLADLANPSCVGKATFPPCPNPNVSLPCSPTSPNSSSLGL